MGRSRATLCLTLLTVACQRTVTPEPTPDDTDPFAGRVASSFRLGLLLADGQVPPVEARPVCQIPIHGGGGAFAETRGPETQLTATLSRSPLPDAVAATDQNGVGALFDLSAGIHVLTLDASGLPMRGVLGLHLTTRRTNVLGFIAPDSSDLDLDGNKTEWVLAVDVLPDDDGDGISDDSTRVRAVYGVGGGRIFRHLGGGKSEMVELDADGVELISSPLNDRDGDFIPDETDPDADGDGLEDATNPGSLPCPGFSHDDLFRPGTKHESFECRRCHDPALGNPLTCSDCHAQDGRAWADTPTNPPVDHLQRGCELCHAADQPWAAKPGTSGEHHLAFPLTGLHQKAECFSCHTAGLRKPPQTCESCHLKDAAADHHKSDCVRCHATSGWSPATANHDHFPLTGGHAAVSCDGCHGSGVYQGLSKACASCHLSDAPPKHTPAGFAAQPCENCHQLSAFADFRYTHPQWTLNGTHATLACARCHDSNPTDYTGNQQACSTCHQPPAFPDHSDALTFGTACELCHNETGFVPASAGNYDHSFYPLENSHQTARCGSCHQNGALPNPPRNCSACHMTERPARHAGVFDGECDQCHLTTRFAELRTPHVHTATFPLIGVHASTPCASCHMTTYQAPNACVDCHLADEPANHYGTNCASCHTSNDWNPTGDQNHHSVDASALPLTGGHAGLLCSQCHTSGGYSALPRACESCHTTDTPLGHALAGCDNCHTTARWSQPTRPPANDLHPLTGGHAGRSCESCHGNYAIGSGFADPSPSAACAGCHTVPNGHIAVGATACDSCHQVSGWTPADGGHAGAVPTTPFPYNSWSGRWFPVPHHSASRCNQCHTGPNFSFFSCTTNCHTNNSGLTRQHSGEHLFHFDPNSQNSPPNEGGATWPTGHVGCVKSNCHANGRS